MTKVQANSLLGEELLVEQLASVSIIGNVGKAELQREHSTQTLHTRGMGSPGLSSHDSSLTLMKMHL